MLQIYHRQIFKLLLSNKVLEDPRQRKIFKTTDLAELFNLNEPINGESSESDRLFKDSKLTPVSLKFSSNKIKRMKRLASTLSKNISKQVITKDPEKNINDDDDDDNESCVNPEDNNKIVDERKTNNLRNNNENNLTAYEEVHPININSNMTNHVSSNYNNINDNILNTLYNNATQHDDTNIEIDDHKTDRSSNANRTSVDNTKDHGISEVGQSKSDVTNELPTDNINETKLLHDKPNNKNQRRKKKKSPKEKKHNISALFEGEHVSYLIGRRLIKSHAEEPTHVSDDEYVLKKLFANSSKICDISNV